MHFSFIKCKKLPNYNLYIFLKKVRYRKLKNDNIYISIERERVTVNDKIIVCASYSKTISDY